MRNWNQKKNPVKAWIRTLALAAALLAMPAFAAKEDVPAFARVPYALAEADLTEAGQTKDSAADGTQINDLHIKWVTVSSTTNNEGAAVTPQDGRLFLSTDSNAELSMAFQVEVSFSGQHDYKPGDIRITIPAQIWHARKLTEESNGVMVGSVDEDRLIGSMEMPVPAAPSTASDFNWQLINGNYVLTNVRTISAASSYTFQFIINDLWPMDLVDMSVSEKIQAKVEVLTHDGTTIDLPSNEIDAQVDTIAKIPTKDSAHKTGAVIENYYQGMIPTAMLEKLPGKPEDYVFVRWTSYPARTNNQPFSMKIDDVISNAMKVTQDKVTGNKVKEEINPPVGIFLGSTNYNEGKISEDGKQFNAVASGYNTTSVDGVNYDDMAYMWSAYPKASLPPVVANATETWSYEFTNKITWTMTETDVAVDDDDRKKTFATAESTVTYSPIVWSRPIGHFGVDKYTEQMFKKDWVYGYALNRLKLNEKADMKFIVCTAGYGYQWTTDEIDKEEPALESYGKLGWKQVTEDFETLFEGVKLEKEDFEFKSLEITEPIKMRYGKNTKGQFDYNVDYSLPNPDLKIEYKVDGGEWMHAATITWGEDGLGAMTVKEKADAVSVAGRVITFPEKTTAIRHTYISNVFGGKMAEKCDIAAIRWEVYPVISLKPTDKVKNVVEGLFAQTDEPTSKFRNNVSMNAYIKLDSVDDEGTYAGYDLDYSRATLESANYGVRLEKSVDFDSANKENGGDNDVDREQVTLHYTGVVTEQSSLKSLDDYLAAVESGAIPAETSGVFYDLLPENVQPVLSSVQLRENDTITNVYTVPNYKKTGCTLLVVEAELTPVPVYDPRTMSGWGDQPKITFDAIYSWQDLVIAKNPNVMNYMAFESTVEKLIDNTLGTIDGQMGEPDNPRGGMNGTTPVMPNDIAAALTNLDPNTNENRFVYGKADVDVIVSSAMSSHLDKTVSDDLVGFWTQGLDGMEQVTVFEGHGYTYRLRVSSSQNATKNIVLYDSLENYTPTADKADDLAHVNARKEWEGAWQGKGQWRGTLQAVDLSELIAARVQPVLYYTVIEGGPQLVDDPNADVYKLDDENNKIWQKATIENGQWTVPAGVNVTGIAIDASTNIYGEEFVLKENMSFSAYLKMKAPDDKHNKDTYIAKGAYARMEGSDSKIDWEAATNPENNMYAFNNIYLRHTQYDENKEAWAAPNVIYNDYTRVGIVPQILVVEKEWHDKDNHDNVRPAEVTITAMRKLLGAAGEPVEVKSDGKSIQAVLNAENGWKASFKQLDVIDEHGVRYIYSFKELPVDKYECKIEFVANNKFVLKNIHELETVEISGEKIWEDSDNELGMRPDSVTLHLYCDGEYVKSTTVYPDAQGKWYYSFGELEANKKGGEPHVYTVEEEYVPKYTFDGSALMQNQIKNTYAPYGNLEVRKTVLNATTPKSKVKEFTFSLTLTVEELQDNQLVKVPLTDSYAYKIFDGDSTTATKEGTITGTGTFTLEADQRFVVYDVPSEAEYHVTEQETAGFTVTSTGADGVIQAGRTQHAAFTNEYHAVGYLDIPVTKKLTGRELQSRQFQFVLMDEEGNVIDTVRNEKPAEGATTGGNGTPIVSTAQAFFSRLYYTEQDHGKEFRYYVYEVPEENKNYYTFDDNAYSFTVNVEDNGDGTMSATLNMSGNIEFNNEYHATGNLVLTANKLLHGRGLNADEFTFELLAYDAENQTTVGNVIATATNNAAGEVVFDAITFNQDMVSRDPENPATFTYLIREQAGTAADIIYSTQEYVVTVEAYDDGLGHIVFAIDNQEVTFNESDCTVCAGSGQMPPLTGTFPVVDGNSLATVYTVADGAWFDRPIDLNSAYFEVTLCGTCHGLGTNGQGENCATCYGSGFDGESSGTFFELGMAYELTPCTELFGETNNGLPYFKNTHADMADEQRHFMVFKNVVIFDYGWTQFENVTYFAFMTNRDYLVGLPGTDCTACGGDGKVGGGIELGDPVSNRVFRNEVKPEGLRAAKLLDGKVPTANAFSFQLLDSNRNELQTKSVMNGAVVFDTIEYKAAGTYTYIIKEVAGNDSSITYDETEYTAQVVVTETETGLVSEVTYLDAQNQPLNQIPVFNNTSMPGSLTIVKNIEGATAKAAEQAFVVEISLTDAQFAPWSGTVSVNGTETEIEDGKLTVSVTAVNPVVITNIPAGVSYTAKETGSLPGWTMDPSVKTGTIEPAADSAITFTNSYSAQGHADVQIYKNLVGRELIDGEFTFQLKDDQDNVLSTATNKDTALPNGEIAEGLVKFDQLTFTQEGAYTYTISEVVGDDPTIIYNSGDVTVTIDVEDEDGNGILTATVTYSQPNQTITNNVKTGGLSIAKTTKNTVNNAPFQFTVTLKDPDGKLLNGNFELFTGPDKSEFVVENGIGTLELRGGESVTIKGLPVGSSYTVTETEYAGFVQESENATGTIKANDPDGTDNTAQVKFTNTYTAEGSITFAGKKTMTGRAMTEDDVFTFAISEDGKVIAECHNDASGTINYPEIHYTLADVGTHTYLVYESSANAQGVTVDATIHEVTVKVTDNGKGTLTAEVTGGNGQALDFTNHYSVKAQAEIKAIKLVNGKVDQSFAGKFRFELEGVEGVLTNNAEGYITFTTREYTEEDFEQIGWENDNGTRSIEFSYRLKELFDENDKSAEYDHSVYVVYVALTDNGDGTATSGVKYFKITPDSTGDQSAATDTLPVFNNIYKSGSITFEGTKTMRGRAMTADDEFTFEVLEMITDDEGDVLTIPVGTATNAADGTINYPEINYTLADLGEHMYVIKETPVNNVAGVTSFPMVYTVTVTVSDTYGDTLNVVASRNANKLDFVNTYLATGEITFEGTKTMAGRTITENDIFSFEIAEKGTNNTWIVQNDKNGKINYPTISYTQYDAGEHIYTVKENSENGDGMIVDSTEYEVTVDVTDNGNGTLDIQVSDNAKNLNFENKEITEATVKKIWNDANNQDGKRPTELKVTLSNGEEVTLNEANGWTATVGNLPKYAAGVEIKYTWAEVNVPGYTLAGDVTNGTVTTLTNTHTPELTEATIVKVWDDANNQDGKRPAELKVTLSDGTEVTLNADNEWTATVTGLPKYADGVEIKYTWTEAEDELPAGYKLTGSSTEGTVTTLTNTHTPETTEATVKKVWDDANNQDGKRPTELKVTLSDGTEVTLNEGNKWTATVENLPKYANGAEIEYTWTEEDLPEGYTLSSTAKEGTVTTLTNTHTPEETEATIVKVWDDANNQDGKRPTELKVTLSNGTEVTLNEGNKWTATVENLPKYANGAEIEYTWTEAEDELPAGYELTDTAKVGTVTTLTNSYEPEETEATIVKVWDDAENQDGKRPASLTVTLSNGTEVTLNEANGWTATIKELPKYANGVEIEYSWTEDEAELPEGYELTGNSTEGTVTTLTNSYEPEETEATIVKVWDDANNQDGKRPTELKVTLSNGEMVTLNADNEWTATVTGLPKYANGVEIKYTWTEAEDELPAGYKLTGNSTEGTVTMLTNSHTPEITTATIKKIWDDANNQDGKRPTELKVTLSNGEEVTLNEGNKWTATVENLPKYANGAEIEYTWTEEDLPEGYTLSSTAKEGTVTTLTNSHTPEITTATVKKVWDDANNQDGKRPTELKVTLSNGEEVTLNEGNKWTATVENLPKYANGVEIVYTWTEGDMPEGYTLTNTAKVGTITTLTNSRTPETTEATVKKVWDDANNQDGKRPTELKVTLSNGTEVTLNEGNKWTVTVENLPKYANGEEITYTWTEGAMPEGYTLTNTAKVGTITTLTNGYTPETTTATVKKVWADAENQDGKRPAELKVTLSDGTEVTLNADNEWTATVGNLPKYANGVEIEYTWAEASVPAGYMLTGNSTEGTVTTLTNTHTPETTEATIVKVWNDANNQDGKRPASLTVTLSDGTEVTLNADNEWTATVTGLPKYADGVEIEYSWTEGAMPEGYTLTNTVVNGTITTLTNSYEPEETEATVKKVWNDANNQDGKRPTELKVTLSNGTEVTLNEDNEWTATVGNLPKYANGVEIEYTWAEASVPAGYTLTGNSTEGTVTTLTNSYTPEETEATIVKVWADAENQDGKRPTELKVTLSDGTEVTLNEANGWTATVGNLPKYAAGVEIKYTWAEVNVPGYTLAGDVTNGTVTTLTNTHTPELTEATIVKVWDDANNQDGKRPTELKVTLSDGTEVTLNADNEWTATVTGLPKYADGVEIKYTWTEAEDELPAGYKLTGNSTEGTVTTLTNSYTPEVTEATIVKVWDDAENQDGKRPASLTVTLSNGTEVTLNADNEWTATVTGLPKYANGEEIEYSWTEGTVPAGYELTGNSTEGTVTTLTNTHTPEETEATIVKVWADANNQDGKRPESLTVTLSNGTEVTLNEDNEWTATVGNLPKYANGVEIEYSWTEGSMPEGYTLTSTAKEGTVTTLTNSYMPDTTMAAVKKVWIDRDNQGGSRPDSLVVKLLANGIDTGRSVTLSESNNWYAELNDLAKYNAGEEIEYAWAEIDVPDYYEQTNKTVNGTLTTFTNTYSAEGKIQFAGTKKIEGRNMTADDVFTFGIWEKVKNENGKEQEVAIATVQNDAPSGKINYPVIEYTLDDVGTHTYVVRETSKNGNGITVDTHAYAVVVIVSDNGDGTLSVVSSENATKLDFVNTYDAGIAFTLSAFKTMDGQEPADDQVFNFICRDEQTQVELAAQNENGSITFGPISFGLKDAGKTFTYTIWEETESSEYVIADESVYTVYLTIKDAGNGTLKADHVIKCNGEAADTVIFNNRAVAPLTISKKVENVQTSETFKMVVHFFDGEGKPLNDEFAFTGNAEGKIVSGGSIELGHDQSVTIHGLPVGTRYTVKEEGSLAYTATVNGEAGREIEDEIIPDENNRVDFVNTMETTTFSVTKVWDDGRSDEIQLTLYANGVKMDPQPAYTRQGSMYVYDNLPWYDENGEVIVYSAKEKGIEGYLTIYNNIDPYKDKTKFIYDGGTIINRPEQVKELSFQIRKIWQNMNGEEPQQIELKLYCNGVEMNKPTPKPDRNGWYKYYNLPKTVNGQPAVYTVVEVPLAGYATFYEDANGSRMEYGVNGGTIINEKLPKTGDSQSAAMWMLMLSMSLGGMLMLMKRKAKA